MARWALGWLLMIALLTVVSFVGTSRLVRESDFANASYAMLPLGAPGSPECTRAGRGLVAAGNGSAPGATPAQRTAYDRAAAAVLAACSG